MPLIPYGLFKCFRLKDAKKSCRHADLVSTNANRLRSKDPPPNLCRYVRGYQHDVEFTIRPGVLKHFPLYEGCGTLKLRN